MKTIVDAVRKGEPLDITPFIDVHCHFGHWGTTLVPYKVDDVKFVDEMDRYGCDMVWLSASQPGWAGDLSAKNDLVFGLADKYPERIAPYCTLSSNTPDTAVEELERCLSMGRCVGVKMHRYNQRRYTMKSDFLQPVLEILNERNLVYLNHVFVDHDSLVWAADRYSDVLFLSGHGVDRFINDLACTHENIRDCTCAARELNAIKDEVNRLGRSDTLLVGSDFNLFYLGFGIGMVAYADISEEAKRDIIGRNAIRRLNRIAWGPEMIGALGLRSAE